ncbi:MAG: ATP-binding protein [Bacilli bacterium]|nr:ATP-binding protein [Bacilli bacterium]
MLKEFRVTNYKSIREEQVFTMEACPAKLVSEYQDHVIKAGKERLLKVASIYGPNGGGKSNLLKAMSTFCGIVLRSMYLNDSIKDENYFPNVFLRGKDTVFTLYIVSEGYEIGYSLTVDLNKMTQQFNPQSFASPFAWAIDFEIKKEEMVCRKLEEKEFAQLFERNSKGIVTCETLKDVDLIKGKRSLAKNYTFLKYFTETFKDDSSPISVFFKEISSYLWPRMEDTPFNYTKETMEPLKNCLGKAKEILNVFDMRITKLEFKEVAQGVFHPYIERKNEDGEVFSIPLGNESSGTIKVINLVFAILSKKGGVCFADDFDSHLHPKLIRAIVEMFTSKENESRQLIFNSHDITNMNNKLFRRDEIWFAYRDERFSTIYTPLSNIVNYKGEMVRKDAVYGKQYLEGRFGADPFIKKGLTWCD